MMPVVELMLFLHGRHPDATPCITPGCHRTVPTGQKRRRCHRCCHQTRRPQQRRVAA